MSAPSVGAQLKRARTDLQRSLKEVTQATKIQAWVLEALEADQLHHAMSPVYVKGFLSTYAKFLRVDAEPLIQALFPAPPPSEPPTSSAAPHASETMRRRVLDAVLPVLPRAGAIAVGLAGLVLVAVAKPFRWIPLRAPVQQATLSIAKTPLSPPPEPTINLQATHPLELVLRANRQTWVSVKADGHLVAQQQLTPGSRETWTARRRFEVIVAIPSSVDALLNGHPISPFVMAHHGRLVITHKQITHLPDSAE